MIFGSVSISGVNDDIEDEVVIDFLFGQGRLTIDGYGVFKVPKPEPLELDDRDRQYMYRVRVLEGDLPLIPADPYF